MLTERWDWGSGGGAGGFRSAVHMVAVVASYGNPLALGRPFLSTFAQMKYPFYLVRGSFLALGILSVCMRQAS